MIMLDQTFWEIKNTTRKGKGVFAKKDLAPGIIIGDYIGKVIKTAEEDTSEKNGLYLLYYHDYASLYPEDINKPGIHMVNHSCVPNCWIYTYKGHTLFFTLRKIFAGEELTISYLLSPDDYCDPCTHACICESKFCTGTMHLTKEQFQAWNTFNENESKKTKRAPIRYGKMLSKLKAYPATIADNYIYTLFGTTKKPAQQYTDIKLPSLEELRRRIRNTGRSMNFPNLKLIILGVKNNKLISA
jgi:uncharacterized protein